MIRDLIITGLWKYVICSAWVRGPGLQCPFIYPGKGPTEWRFKWCLSTWRLSGQKYEELNCDLGCEMMDQLFNLQKPAGIASFENKARSLFWNSDGVSGCTSYTIISHMCIFLSSFQQSLALDVTSHLGPGPGWWFIISQVYACGVGLCGWVYHLLEVAGKLHRTYSVDLFLLQWVCRAVGSSKAWQGCPASLWSRFSPLNERWPHSLNWQ